MAKPSSKKEDIKTTSVLARQEDGTVQITITVPKNTVEEKKEEAFQHLVENLQVPGFRKGKAPKDVAEKHIDSQKLYDHMLQHLLPEIYADSVTKHDLHPILAPRFELVSINENSDWQIRVITCELPEVSLGNYKDEIKAAGKVKNIWVPGKDSKGSQEEAKKEASREEKEQEVLKALVEKTEIKVPQLLIEEEVNHRLAQLVDQVQKLGLTVEQYLASTGKSVDQVKGEFAGQAEAALKLELALNKIAEEEKIDISDEEVDQLIEATGDEKTKEALSQPSQKRLIKSTLKRRRALDTLVSLI